MMTIQNLKLKFLLAILITGFCASAQTRYFLVREHVTAQAPAWQDSLFVIKVSDPDIQAEIDAELSLPWQSRTKIVSGSVLSGDGGFNKNGTHCFNWHYSDETVHLTDVATEVCDGWPYQDCELANFPDNPGFFCPWSMRVWDEVEHPESCSLSVPDKELQDKIFIYPNPARDHITIHLQGTTNKVKVQILDALGNTVLSESDADPLQEIYMGNLYAGLYVLIIYDGDKKVSAKLIKI